MAAGYNIYIRVIDRKYFPSGVLGKTTAITKFEPSSSMIRYDPFIGHLVLENDRFIRDDGTDVLAHEMSHAYDFAFKVLYVENHDPDDEVTAVRIQNQIRALLGRKLLETYRGADVPDYDEFVKKNSDDF